MTKGGGRWKIAVGNMWLLDFGDKEVEARRALEIIRHYRMNSQCFVGRPDPGMQYYLADGAAPVGPFPGEDAIRFDRSRIEAKHVGGRWKVVEGDHWMLDFGGSQEEAETAVAIIKKYRFDYICFVGRPQASMQYFRR